MLAIALGIIVAVLDAAVANIALPAIARDLHAAPAAVVWVVNAYQLATVASLLPLASLGERIGYRRVYVGGLAIFTVGSLACALSHDLPILIVARAVQGLGAAGIMSMNGALVRFTYPLKMLGRGVGLNALMVSLAAAAGPSVASAILAVGSWEWLFAVNVPIGLFNLVLAAYALPYSPLGDHRLDWISTGLNAITFGLLFIGVDGLTHGTRLDWTAVGEVGAAIVAGVALARREFGASVPLIPLDLLKIPIFGLSAATSICSFAAYMLAFLALPFYFESALHLGQVETGLLMTPWPVAVGLSVPIAGRLSDRLPAAILGAGGLVALAIGLALLATMPLDATRFAIVWRMGLCGFGFGFFQAPNNRTMLASAPRSRAGAAGGMLATARLLGMTAGAAVAAAVFSLAARNAETIDLGIGVAFALVAVALSLGRLSAPAREIADATR